MNKTSNKKQNDQTEKLTGVGGVEVSFRCAVVEVHVGEGKRVWRIGWWEAFVDLKGEVGRKGKNALQYSRG